jgi:hypothetical protein
MPEYDGPERRRSDAALAEMLGRIDERTKTIVETIPTLATKERVDALAEKITITDGKIESHTKNHQDMAVNRNLIAGSYITGFAGVVGLFIALFKH